MVQILGGQLIFNHVVQKQILQSGINWRGSICKTRCGQIQTMQQKARPSFHLEIEIEKSSKAANIP